MADANGSECFSYDPQGHLAARRIVTYGRDYTTGYGYDAVGALSSMSYPSGTAVQYTRTGGEITQVKAMVNGATINVVAGAALDADGRLTNWSYGNGMVCAGQRHGNVRLRRAGAVDQRVHPAAGSAVGYGYDANGNLNRPGFLGGRLV